MFVNLLFPDHVVVKYSTVKHIVIFYLDWYSSKNSPTLMGYLSEVFSVELHCSDNKNNNSKTNRNNDLLIMFSKPLSPFTKPKTNTGLFESGSQIFPCFDLKYTFSGEIYKVA